MKLATLVISIVNRFLIIFTLFYWWQWFFMDIFELKPITFIQSFIMTEFMALIMFTPSRGKVKLDEEDSLFNTIECFVVLLISYGLGSFIHLMM